VLASRAATSWPVGATGAVMEDADEGVEEAAEADGVEEAEEAEGAPGEDTEGAAGCASLRARPVGATALFTTWVALDPTLARARAPGSAAAPEDAQAAVPTATASVASVSLSPVRGER
jgi:hypothetical protein